MLTVAAEVKSWFDLDLSWQSLLTQVLAVLLATGLLHAVLGRLGVRVPAQPLVLAAVLVFLSIQVVGDFRERWDGLDRLEAGNEGTTAQAGRQVCLSTGPDPEAVAWAKSRLPPRARFFVPPAPSLVKGGGTCIRFLLLPRLQVRSLERADYVLVWDPPADALLSRLRQQGAVIETFKDRYVLARLP